MQHCTTLIVELETRERCKWSEEIINFFITFINKTNKHNCNETIL